MQIDVQLLPSPLHSHLISYRAVVVLDVLRATSVMVHAIAQGAKEIIPVETVEEAFQMATTFPPKSTLLGGEKESKAIEGFDLGNSPREYMAEKVRGKRLIMTTTNGTRAFHSVSSGKEVLVGSFLNLSAVVQRCLDTNKDLLIYPSGDEGDFSLEDAVCGGMLIERLIKTGRKPVILTDASHVARILYQRFETNLLEAFYLSRHGKELVDRGYEDDFPFCAQIDVTKIVPIFKEGMIRTPSVSPGEAVS
jgi:2-phosphosulfolactate phosphatase